MLDAVELLDREAELGDDVRFGGVAVEGVLVGGDVKAVIRLNIAVVVFDVQTVVLDGGALDAVGCAVVVALEDKAVLRIVGDFRLAEVGEAPAARQGVDVHLILESVFTAGNLLAYLLSLPVKPVGDVGELGLALKGCERAVLVQIPVLAACGAEDFGALGRHLGLGQAVRALVQHLVQTFGAERLGDEDAVLFLIAVFVVLKRLLDGGVDIVRGHRLDLLGGEDLRHRHIQRYPAGFTEVPERGEQVVAVVLDDHDGHLVHLDELAECFGQIGGGAAGGVACLGVHTEDVAALEHAVNGLNEMQIGGELARADRADELHQPRTAVIAVNAHDVVDAVGIGRHRCDLKIDEILVVTQQHIRRLDALHMDLFDLILFADEHDFG